MATSIDRLLSAPRAWQAFALTFVAYLLVARASLLLAIAPSGVAPLYPAAGIAVVAALAWGRPALLAVALGSLGAGLWSAAPGIKWDAAGVAIAGGIGIGAALQAGLGALLTKRFVGLPLLLAEPLQLWRFVLAAALLPCCVSASVGVAVLLGAGHLAAAQILPTWATWWVGDVLGVMIFAPVMLTLIGQPREEWAPRRGPVALPLVVAALLIGLGIRQVTHTEIERQRQAFARQADSIANGVQVRLLQPLLALQAMHGLISESAVADRGAFRRASAPWLGGSGGLSALGWNERVAGTDVPAFEARERAAGLTGFRVFDHDNADSRTTSGTDLQVIRFVEPLDDNLSALGVNAKTMPMARSAIEQAVRTGAPVASAGFRLAQGSTGVVVYLAVYRGRPATDADRVSAQRGVVFATLRPDDLVRTAVPATSSGLRLCLLDNDAPADARLLAGAPGCDSLNRSAALQHVSPLAVAGRKWDLRVYSAAPLATDLGSTWPYALISLAVAAMLGALLLVVTGRSRRIEAAVQLRTAELQQRSAELQAEVVERQRATSALRDSQQRLRNILDHTPIGVAYTDTTGRIREANPKLRQMLGTEGPRVAATFIADLIHPDDRHAEAEARQRLLAGDVPMSRSRLRYLTVDGRTLWAQVGVSVLRDSNGIAKRMVWVVEDITEHLALEESKRAREGAEAANRAKSEFLSRMSHELRTPLNAMLGFSQLLELDRRQPLAPHQSEWTTQIRQAGWHLLHMINDTLDLARIESGHIEVDTRPLDLGELVAEVVALLARNAEERGIGIDVRLFEGASAVRGDRTRVKQVLTNLLSNAIKYNVDGGRVLISSHATARDMVALEISDTGEGMDATQLAQLFQPFNRLGRESGPVEGTGIGLVISLRLAELMGGTLRARSNRGGGSTFTLELPRVVAPPQPLPDGDDDDLPDATYHQRIVHYIEDNETNAEVMRGIMALRPQVKLEVSALGLDGLAAIRQSRPSLILLDMHLPDIDGLELLRHLQSDPGTSDIPVIVVSADANGARIDEAIAAGATHYLTKPVNVAQFLAALDEMLEQLDTMFG
jgi:PAS domain S-box-containing protein